MKKLQELSKGFFVFAVLTIVMLPLGSCDNDDDDNANVSDMDLETVAEGYVSPISVVTAPDNTDRLFVIDQVGRIWIIDSDDNKLETPFLDLTSTTVPLNAAYDERGANCT